MDSVMLMWAAVELEKRPEIARAECGMGTPQNVDLLREEGYKVDASVTKNDLLMAFECENESDLSEAYRAGLELISGGSGRRKTVYNSIEELPENEYDIVQISIPGAYALAEAYKAIDRGMDVFMFTADVSLSDERALKEYGRDHGCLVMGPDAGVGLLGGVAMAAGSIVNAGPVGIIGASGSGSQEVACLIEEMGSGVTCILGTGGRDLKKEVGGVSMMADMDRLEKDPDTKLICLVSMLADREIMEKVLTKADGLEKPVVAVFLGADEALYRGHRVTGAYDLSEAAKACVRILSGKEPRLGKSEEEMEETANREARKFSGQKRYFRGLYTGGTFAEETLMTFRSEAPEIELYTNRDNTKYAKRLRTHKKSEGNTLLDLGDLDFTAEAPHTVFEPTTRFNRFLEELEDPEVALIAMDIILGPGVAPDPVSCYLPYMKARKDVVFITSVCGGQQDPQDKAKCRALLREAGAIVLSSNHEAALLSAKIMKKQMEVRHA